MKTLASALILLGAARGVAAQSNPPIAVPLHKLESAPKAVSGADYMIVGGEWNRLVSAPAGGTGSIDWLHATPKGGTYAAGVSTSAVADSRWTLSRGGIAVRPTERVVLHAQARIGGGLTAERRFAYRAYEGGLAVRTAARVYLTFADQYLHVADTRGHLLKPGVAFAAAEHVTTELTYARSAGGNLHSEYVAGRVSVAMRQTTVIGGLAAGRTGPEVFDIGVGSTVRAGPTNLREGFAGLQVRVPRAELTLVWSDLDVESIHRQTLTASVKYRLGAK